MSRLKEIRELMIVEMCEAGDLIRRGDDIYEDMGGHCVHESQLDSYIEDYLKNMKADERNELIDRLTQETEE